MPSDRSLVSGMNRKQLHESAVHLGRASRAALTAAERSASASHASRARWARAKGEDKEWEVATDPRRATKVKRPIRAA